MDWNSFNTHGDSHEHAFEVMCNIIFEAWCKNEYGNRIIHFSFVNGTGGDGGVEAYAILDDKSIIAVQSKWFRDKIEASQIKQLSDSFNTAIKIRPNLKQYIVCLPRDLGSTRYSRNNTPAHTTEENRWELFVEQCKTVDPTVDVVLWSETKLLERLVTPSLQGVYNFWFKRTEAFDNAFNISFNKAIGSWAKENYIPDIYSEGVIHETLSLNFGSYAYSEKRYNSLKNLFNEMDALRHSYGDLISLGIPKEEKDIEEKIKNDISVLDEWLDLLRSNESLIRDGEIVRFNDDFELSCKEDDLKNSSLHFGKYAFFYDIEKTLNSIYETYYKFRRLFEINSDNRIVFLGNPGSGKTTGIVGEMSQWLEETTHLPILVHAKDFARGDNWCSILQRTLGLSSDWNENEMFTSMENVALLRRHPNPDGIGIVPKVVICVDGVDEADWCFWREKINEVKAFAEPYPYLRFVFLSRPYVFDKWYELDYRQCFKSLPMNGDVPVTKLLDAYFSKYRITIGNNHWIKQVLRTPLSVRLFCDVYSNSSVEKLDKNTTAITRLFKKKIDSIEDRYKDRITESFPAGYMKNVLCILADLFIDNNPITYSCIKESVSDQFRNSIDIILDCLSQEGFIFHYYNNTDDFSSQELLYSWGMQPAFDYLIAQKTFRAIDHGKEIRITEETGVSQMLALIVAEEKGKLLSEYNNVEIDESTLFSLSCYMLSNASVCAAGAFRDYLFELVNTSVDRFRYVVNKVIIPTSGIYDHPVGARFLDCFLRGFEHSVVRDIWWSIPAYLRNSSEADWHSSIDLDFEYIELATDDNAFTKPLVLAWSLSSVNNEVRRSARLKLSKWGIVNPISFFELLIYLSDLNDEQVLEDLFSIAYGIAFDPNVEQEYLIRLCTWILENVFSKSGLIKYENSFIRHFCSGIIKIAVSRELMVVGSEIAINPPFKNANHYLEIAPEAAKSVRMSGFLAIDYDLARYVLCDELDEFFKTSFDTGLYHTETEHFLEFYKNKYKIHDLTVDGLIISMAYQYLRSQGWDASVFWHYDEKNNMGIDNAIRNTYHQADHGAMSAVMTITEKNVWISRHKMEAFFADVLPYDYRRNEDDSTYINNYALLESFTNLFQEITNDSIRFKKSKWFHMETLTKIGTDTINKNTIENWMQHGQVPDFEEWIFNYETSILLNSFTHSKNNYAGIEETIWISSGIVNQQTFKVFIDNLDLYFDARYELTRVNDFTTQFDDVRCCSPIEACLVYPELESNRDICFDANGKRIRIKKMVSSCLCKDEVETEKTYIFPSNIARTLLDITYCDGYQFFNEKGEVIADYYTNREPFNTSQEILLVNKDALNSALRKHHYKMFWVFRVYRNPSLKVYEQYPSILHDTDRTYIVWKENRKVVFKEFVDVEMPRQNNICYDDPLMRLIQSYSSVDCTDTDDKSKSNDIEE